MTASQNLYPFFLLTKVAVAFICTFVKPKSNEKCIKKSKEKFSVIFDKIGQIYLNIINHTHTKYVCVISKKIKISKCLTLYKHAY